MAPRQRKSAPDTPYAPGAPRTPEHAPMADLQKLKRYFSEAQTTTAEARRNSLRALDYFDSDQFTRAELEAFAKRRQPPVVINRIKPAINGIIGVTERARSDPQCWPRNPDDTDSADVATDVLRYIADFNRFKRVKQDCFKDLLVPGSMAALIGVDGDAEVTVTQIRWEEFFHDPRARRPDFKDARYLGIAKWMYADDAEALYPEKAGDIAASVNNGMSPSGMTDRSFQDRPLAGLGSGSSSATWIDPRMRRLMVIEIYYQEGGAWIRCVFTGADILECGPSPYVDHRGRPECPIEAQSAYVKQDNSRYGVVWDMIGPQDEINKRRSKSLHVISVNRLKASDPSLLGADIQDVDRVRAEAARPDAAIPFGWDIIPNNAELTGNMELLAEAKGEIERMGPSPAILGRNEHDDSGRALLARQQAGLVELAPLYGGLEDWELRVYRQMWARAKQYWTAPRFIRVTDDQDAPKFVGLNQPVPGPPTVGLHPETGMPTIVPSVLGYKNSMGEMDVDIEIDSQADNATVQLEAFNQLMKLVSASPVYQQQVPLTTLIQLSPIPHKRQVLDVIKQSSDAQAASAAQAQQLSRAMAMAKLDETRARTAELQAKPQLHAATAFAKASDAVTYAHQDHADAASAGIAAGLDHGQTQQAQAFQTSQDALQSDQQGGAQPAPDAGQAGQ